MRYPVNNYKEEWDNHSGYDFGDATAYGFHDGKDINDSGGGNSDLGKALFAIAPGRVVGVHKHIGSGNFGNHFFMLIDGVWGVRYVHYAHCLELFVTEGQQIEEGYKVALVGNSGTTYAHCHFAIKTKANGMDTVANTKAQLDDAWEDPIPFIEKYLPQTVPETESTSTTKQVLDDKNKYDFGGFLGVLELGAIRSIVLDQRSTIVNMDMQRSALQQQLVDCQNSPSQSANILTQIRELFRKILG